MSSSPVVQEIARKLRRRAVSGESTIDMLRWLKGELAARGLDQSATAFSMTRILREAFDIGLSPARFVASWNELSEEGHLSSEELMERLGPLVPSVDDEEQ